MLAPKVQAKYLAGSQEVIYAYDAGQIDLQAACKVRIHGKLQETSVGRAILSDIVPREVPFETVNRVMNKKTIANLIDSSFRLAGAKSTVLLADKLMRLGFKFSTQAGISICIDDMIIPASKERLLKDAETSSSRNSKTVR